MKKTKGFTLIELMAVILIISILVPIAIPIIRSRIGTAKWAEAKAGMGTIATALRAYATDAKAATTSLSDLGLTDGDLQGAYFVIDDYSIVGASFTVGNDPELTFTIRCDKETMTPSRWELDNTGTWTSSNPK